MSHFQIGSVLTCLMACALASPAAAQEEPVKGPYVVVRGGASITSDQKFDLEALPGSSTFERKTKYKTGATGQIGGGYDFGMVRIEQTIGYSTNSLDEKDARSGTLAATGKSKSLSMTLAGYVDLPVSRVFVPYVGGGIGAARVEANQARIDSVTGAGSSYSGKDWGLMWHADAGIGINVMPKTTLEIGGRYSQTDKLSFQGQNAGTAATFEPKIRNISATVGVRHVF